TLRDPAVRTACAVGLTWTSVDDEHGTARFASLPLLTYYRNTTRGETEASRVCFLPLLASVEKEERDLREDARRAGARLPFETGIIGASVTDRRPRREAHCPDEDPPPPPKRGRISIRSADEPEEPRTAEPSNAPT